MAQAVDFVRERLAQGVSPKEVCEQLCDHCLAPNTDGCGKGCDNMSVLVVLLKAFANLHPTGALQFLWALGKDKIGVLMWNNLSAGTGEAVMGEAGAPARNARRRAGTPGPGAVSL